ncbi:MAG: hypothetical protein ACE5NG_01395 [bacterium]
MGKFAAGVTIIILKPSASVPQPKINNTVTGQILDTIKQDEQDKRYLVYQLK